MLGGTLKNQKCPIGIDLGSHSIKMLQLERVEAGIRAVAAASREIPSDLSPTNEAYPEFVRDLIRDMLSRSAFKGRSVVSALPTTAVHYKNLRLPKMPAAELQAAVEWEAGEHLQFMGEPAAIQYIEAGEVTQGEDQRLEVILLAASQALIEQHVAILTGCGLQPIAIDATPNALARCLHRDRDYEEDINVEQMPVSVMIDIGFDASKVLIYRGRQIVFFKLIDIGGRKLDETIATQLKMPVSEVSDLRRQLSDEAVDSDSDDEVSPSRPNQVQRAIFEALRAPVSHLARELALCLRYYSVTFRGRRPEEVMLVGGESRQSWLVPLIEEGASVKVKLVNPLDGIDLASVDKNGSIARSVRAWTVAAGLSLRREEAGLLKRGAA